VYHALERSRSIDHEGAIRELKELIGYASAAGHVGGEVWIRAALARDQVALGLIDEAAENLGQAERLAAGSPLADWLVGPIARVEIAHGHLGKARARLERAPDAPRVFRVFVEHDRRLARAELALAEGDAPSAATVARRWRDQQRSGGTAYELPELFALEGEALVRGGRISEAIEVLSEGERVADDSGDLRFQQRIRDLRAVAIASLSATG
jgi:ATP/maltotriose-dependent transcriptional regulator MalT